MSKTIGNWEYGLCGCFNNVATCILTFFLPCYIYGKAAEHSRTPSDTRSNKVIHTTMQHGNWRRNYVYYGNNPNSGKHRKNMIQSRNLYDSRLRTKYVSDGEAYDEMYTNGRNVNNVHRSKSNPSHSINGNKSDSDMTDSSVLFLKRKSKIYNIETSSSLRSPYDSLSIPREYDSYQYQGHSSFTCYRKLAIIIGVVLAVVVVLTPVIFLIFPILLWKFPDCDVFCWLQCALLGFKIAIAAISFYFLLSYRANAKFPSFQPKTLFLWFISVGFIIGNCVFFVVGVVYFRSLSYDELLNYVHSLANFAFYILLMAVIIIFLAPINTKYYLTVVRNTDGERKFYAVGDLSLQEAAASILEQYYKDFTDYNPYLDRYIFRKTHDAATCFKVYNFVNSSNPPRDYFPAAAEAIFASVIKNSSNQCCDQISVEAEYDRKIRNRRASLVFVTEEAFSYVRHLSEEEKRFIPSMDASEIACAIFPAISRSLHKYLKSTRQLHLHTVDSIREHLTHCILLDLSPRAFLEKYLKPLPVIINECEQNETQYWNIITEAAPNQLINSETMFQLRKNETTLVVNVLKIPHFSISEACMDATDNRYMLNVEQQNSSV